MLVYSERWLEGICGPLSLQTFPQSRYRLVKGGGVSSSHVVKHEQEIAALLLKKQRQRRII